MRITDLRPTDEDLISQVASILIEAFRENWPDAWPDKESALEEVRESFDPEHISRVALDEEGKVLGWIGGISGYDGNVWELHPLAVDPRRHGDGIGTQLVADFEEQVRKRGGLTISLGTDDVSNQTTLSGVDLYSDLGDRIKNIRNLRRHPYEFYQKLGYTIVGVMPDANGYGKPDIIMAKRLSYPSDKT